MTKPLKLREIADATGIPLETLRWYRKHDLGPRTFKLGRYVVADPADVEAWVEAARKQGRGGPAA